MNEETLPRPTQDREIASTLDGIDITRGYTGPLLIPADRVLRQRGGGDVAIYEQVLSEPQVHTAFQQRRLAVVSKEWQVDAASDSAADVQAKEFIEAQLDRVGFDRVTDRMLYGVFYGYAVAEMLYGVEDGRIVWNAIKVRNRRRFRYTPAGELRMLTLDNMFEGVELPGEKFWHFSTGADHDDEPYGLGLGHWCYWPTLFKRNGVKFWLTFVEKFAMPTGIGEYDQGSSDSERAKLLGAVRAIQSDSGIIIPKGMAIRLLEAARSGSSDYKALHDTMDETIAKVILGQVASTQGTPGRLGNDDLQSDVRSELVKADADLVCESLNRGPIAWLTRWNFPNAQPPRVYRVVDAPEDATAQAERDHKIYTMGFKPTLASVTEKYGGEWVEIAPPAPAPTPALDFAASGAADTTDEALAAKLAEAAAPAWGSVLDRVRDMVAGAPDLPALRDQLLASYSELPEEQLGEVMAMAFAAAELSGRFDIQQEARG